MSPDNRDVLNEVDAADLDHAINCKEERCQRCYVVTKRINERLREIRREQCTWLWDVRAQNRNKSHWQHAGTTTRSEMQAWKTAIQMVPHDALWFEIAVMVRYADGWTSYLGTLQRRAETPRPVKKDV